MRISGHQIYQVVSLDRHLLFEQCEPRSADGLKSRLSEVEPVRESLVGGEPGEPIFPIVFNELMNGSFFIKAVEMTEQVHSDEFLVGKQRLAVVTGALRTGLVAGSSGHHFPASGPERSRQKFRAIFFSQRAGASSAPLTVMRLSVLPPLLDRCTTEFATNCIRKYAVIKCPSISDDRSVDPILFCLYLSGV